MDRSHVQVSVLTVSLVSALFWVQPIAAQVVPDATLPAGERSQVSGNPTIQIDGGARRGGNLFHSFSQFSIPTGGSAYFNNAVDVQNIFSRVTGGSVSSIDGVIRANGTANLFLLNPNGILFGSNARLNIGGSFVATTANSINFADNFQYSATNPPTPLLTISVPIGLQMGANPGPIAVQGNGYDLSVSVPIFSPIVRDSSTAGLRVPAGRTLALIGGDVDINGGTLTAEQGRIELGSVRNGQVSFSDGFTFSYPGVQTFKDIRLSQQALADASGGGVIQVQGNQVSLADGSLLLIQNQGTQTGGRIKVNATQSLEMSGTDPQSRIIGGLDSETAGIGRGAEITVSSRQLLAQGGAAIVARSYSAAGTGNVTVNASDDVRLIGYSPNDPRLTSSLATVTFSSGDAGNITVSTGRLIALNGGSVSAPTQGEGKGGTVTVNATESVELIGQTSFFGPSSVNSAVFNTGNGGSVSVNTSRLVIREGGNVSSSTVTTGNAGSVTINASEFVEVSGTVFGLPSTVGSTAPILPESTRQAYGLPNRPGGNSGSVTINTPRLSISDGANVTVSNDGTASAGTLRIHANSILLDRGGTLTAATASGEGGNINLNVRDFILLRNGSPITASADGTGNGGNIRINAGSIVAVPTENSDIRANSVNARGGNITINTSGIFGIQFRPQDTPLSDITATGASSAQQGTVQLNINQLDPTTGLVQLPSAVVDSSRLIAQGCPADRGNSFIITGRGGIPPTPEQLLDDDAGWDDREILTVAQAVDRGRGGHGDTETWRRGEISHSPFTTPHPPIIEANGWQTTSTGEIILITNTANSTMQNSLNLAQNWLNHSTTCQGKQ
jgi:filamentous hemagglutinin family protein